LHIQRLATARTSPNPMATDRRAILAHMAGKETTLKELGEMLTHVVEHMATKENVADIRGQITGLRKTMATKADVRAIVRDELAPICSELKSIRRDLDDLREKVENVIRFQKEIDHALERIAAIEKHLGINKKIAA